MTIGSRVELWRDNVFYKQLQAAVGEDMTVNVNNEQGIKWEFNATILDDREINYFTDVLKVFSVLDGISYPVGVFIIAEAPLSVKVAPYREIVGYDYTYLADTTKLEQRLSIPAGQTYIEAISQLIIESGITDFVIAPSDLIFMEAREDWEIGDSRLDIINALLSEMNYTTLFADANGRVQAHKKQRPLLENVSLYYNANEVSIIYPEASVENDMFAVPNVFVLTCEQPEKEDRNRDDPELPDWWVRVENNDQYSPTSTVSTGRRVLYTDKLDNIASYEELQAKAEQIMWENMFASEVIEFTTGPNPVHGCFEIMAVSKGEINGIYAEQEWELNLTAPGDMTHKAKKVVIT